jgi:hypothetical protein
MEPAFVICAAVLALAAGGMSIATNRLGLYLQKDPLPLKKPLDGLDESGLKPYVVVGKGRIENADVLKSLGTSDYIQWVLEDPCEPLRSPVRRVQLFITYYALPDRVPHVPEECYSGGGFPCLDIADIVLQIGGSDSRRDIPARYLLFEGPAYTTTLTAPRFPVLYFFRVNDQYAGNREDVRLTLNTSVFSRHAYFSKVELAFNQSSAAPSRQQACAAAERLLNKLLPMLEQEYWPDLSQ